MTRQVDVATNNTMDLARFQKVQPDKAAQIRIIWKSPLIPNDPLVWRKDLPADLKAKIKAFILDYGKQGPDAERQRQVLAHLAQGWLPFHESSDAQLIPIRQLELAKQKMTIESSQTMSPQEKQAQLAAIDAKLADLQKQAQSARSNDSGRSIRSQHLMLLILRRWLMADLLQMGALDRTLQGAPKRTILQALGMGA